MLPKLQTRYSAFFSSVIVGVVWAFWHLPQFFNPSTLYSNLPFVLFLAFTVPFAMLLTWVFNSTGGSVLMAVLLHAVVNASSEMWKVLPEYSGRLTETDAAAATVHVNLLVTVVIWVAAIGVVLVYGPLDLARRPRPVSTSDKKETTERCFTCESKSSDRAGRTKEREGGDRSSG